MIVNIEYLEKNIELEFPDGSSIAEHISSTGTFYEFELLEYIRNTYPTHKTIVDAGAHCGNHPLFCANYLEHKEIHAFEPHPISYPLLVKNTEKYPTIKCYNEGLWSSDVKSTMVQYHNHEPGCTSFSGNKKGKDTILKSLDSKDLKDVTMLIFDMEGPELEALKGSKKTIERDLPVLFVESSPVGNDQYGPDEVDKIEKWLSQFGYIKGNQWYNHITYEWYIPGKHR